MYWRLTKITPQQFLQHNAVHIALAASLLVNFFQLVTRPKQDKLPQQMQQSFVIFAKQVTSHLLDTTYLTFLESTQALDQELAPKVKIFLKQKGLLAQGAELGAMAIQLKRSRQVCAIRFDRVQMSDPTPDGMIPCIVGGKIAVHSSDESGPAEQDFCFRYHIGISKATQQPIIAGFEELPAAPSGGP